MKRNLAIGIAVLLAIGTAAFFFLPVAHWDGGAVCTLDITVCDGDGKPLPEATIVLKYADFSEDQTKNQDLSNRPIAHGSTDSNGKCSIAHGFPAGGTIRAFVRTGQIGFNAINIRAEHEEFYPSEIAVSQFAGSHRSIRANRTIPVSMKLVQQPLSPTVDNH